MVGEKKAGQGEKGSMRGQVDLEWAADAMLESKPRVIPAPPPPPPLPPRHLFSTILLSLQSLKDLLSAFQIFIYFSHFNFMR